MGFIGQDTIVFIRKGGSHYHLPNCQMLTNLPSCYNEYYGVEFKDVDKHQYKSCACSDEHNLRSKQ